MSPPGHLMLSYLEPAADGRIQKIFLDGLPVYYSIMLAILCQCVCRLQKPINAPCGSIAQRG
jgi:hypothetical protein